MSFTVQPSALLPLLSRRALRTAILAAFACAFSEQPALAQIPDTTLVTFTSPSANAQANEHQGFSVAIDGDVVVVGSPFDDRGGQDSGSAKVYHRTTGALLHVLTNPTPGESDQFGHSVAVSGNLIAVGAWQDDGTFMDAGRVYLYDLSKANPTSPAAYINNPNPAAQDFFGASIAIAGTNLFVGTPGENSGIMNDVGCVYVYDVAGTPSVFSLGPASTLSNPTPASGDLFGTSVSASGTLVAVGARWDDFGATDTGRAYVFDLSAASPNTPLANLDNPSPNPTDGFGGAIAISGNHVVVGAKDDDTAGVQTGIAYVYDLSSANPTVPVHTLSHPTPNALEEFGSSVAISGTRVVIGAPWDDVAGYTRAGSAFAYDLSSLTPTVPTPALNNPTNEGSDYFGTAVAVSGSQVVVSAYYDDETADGAGSAYLYNLSTPSPSTPLLTLNTPSPSTGDNFGFAVAASGVHVVTSAFTGGVYVYSLAPANTAPLGLKHPSPFTPKSFGSAVAMHGTRIVVGEYESFVNGTQRGSVHIYDLAGSSPDLSILTIHNPTPTGSAWFGSAVAISGNYVAVGAPFDSTGALHAGIVYIYDLASPTPTVPIATLQNPSPAQGDYFGRSITLSGTLLAVGAPGDDTGGTDSGSIYLFDLANPSHGFPPIISNPFPAAGDSFGHAVSLSGVRLVVGAPADDHLAPDTGRVFVYDLGSATPSIPAFTLNNPSAQALDSFGFSVSISGARVVVGAYQDDTSAMDAGSVYLYDLSSATPTAPIAPINKPSPKQGDNFGQAVAIEGRVIAMGAPSDDVTATNKGALYVLVPYDLTTLPPVFTAPSANSAEGDLVNVMFHLPEAAMPGSVTLSFGSTVLRLATAMETAGYHNFFFDRRDPSASSEVASVVNGPIPEGIHSVTLSYRDSNENAPASVVHENVTIESTDTDGDGIADLDDGDDDNDGAGDHEEDRNGNGNLADDDSDGDGIPNHFDVDDDNDGVPTKFEDVNHNGSYADDDTDGDTLPNFVDPDDDQDGFPTFAEDTNHNGNRLEDDDDEDGTPDYLDPDMVISSPVFTSILSKGGEVPGAGIVFGIPANSTWKSFGIPSINSSRAGCFMATTLSPSGTQLAIYRFGPPNSQYTPLAIADQQAPEVPTGVSFARFKDPILNERGDVAFLATLTGTGVTARNNQGLFIISKEGYPKLVARTGEEPTGLPIGAKWKTISSVAISNNHLAFTGTMTGAGAGVTAKSDTALWIADAARIELALREDQDLTPYGIQKKLRSFVALQALPGAPGHGYGAAVGGLPVQAKFTDGSQAILHVALNVSTTGVTITTIAQPGDSVAEEGSLKSIGLPVQNSSGNTFAWLSTFTGQENPAAIVSRELGGELSSLGRQGDPLLLSPIPLAFRSFSTVALNNLSSSASVARVAGSGVTASNDTALVRRLSGQEWDIVAREGGQVPGLLPGTQWAGFTSIALADQAPTLAFMAKLRVGKPTQPASARVTTANNVGLWIAVPGRDVQWVLREGDPFNQSKVRTISALGVIPGSSAQRREFSSDGREMLLRVVTKDGADHLVHVRLPAPIP